MCQDMTMPFLESVFLGATPYISAINDYVMKRYCKTAISFYDPDKSRILEIPIEDSLSNVLNGSDSDDEFEMMDCIPDMVTTEYRLFILDSVDPEIYYFFKYFDSQSTQIFTDIIKYWGLKLKDEYYMTDSDGQIISLYTDRDELYCRILN